MRVVPFGGASGGMVNRARDLRRRAGRDRASLHARWAPGPPGRRLSMRSTGETDRAKGRRLCRCRRWRGHAGCVPGRASVQSGVPRVTQAAGNISASPGFAPERSRAFPRGTLRIRLRRRKVYRLLPGVLPRVPCRSFRESQEAAIKEVDPSAAAPAGGDASAMSDTRQNCGSPAHGRDIAQIRASARWPTSPDTRSRVKWMSSIIGSVLKTRS